MAITIQKKAAPAPKAQPEIRERGLSADAVTIDRVKELVKVKPAEYMRGYVRGLMQVADRTGSMSMPTRRALLKLADTA